MKQYFLLLLVALLATSCAYKKPVDADLVVRNVTLIDGTGATPGNNISIFLWQGVITTVDTNGEAVAPEGTREIDGTGRFVIPGLIDVYTHLSSGGLEERDSATVPRLLRQFLHYGVTSVLNVGGAGGADREILALRKAHPARDTTAPRIFATGSMLTVPGIHPLPAFTEIGPQGGEGSLERMGVTFVRNEKDMAEAFLAKADHDFNGVKIIVASGPALFPRHPGMQRNLIRAAVAEGRNTGMRVFAHATSRDAMSDAVTAGVDAIMHSIDDGTLPDTALASAMKDKGVFFVPTLSLYSSFVRYIDTPDLLDDPFLTRGIPAQTLGSLKEVDFLRERVSHKADIIRDRLPEMVNAVRLLHNLGVPVAVGSDCGNPFSFPGYGVHLEMDLLVQAGLTPMEALMAATIRGAELIGKEHLLGTIEVGKAADLLLLSSNPLEDIRNTRTIEIVIKGGKIVVERGREQR